MTHTISKDQFTRGRWILTIDRRPATPTERASSGVDAHWRTGSDDKLQGSVTVQTPICAACDPRAKVIEVLEAALVELKGATYNGRTM